MLVCSHWKRIILYRRAKTCWNILLIFSCFKIKVNDLDEERRRFARAGDWINLTPSRILRGFRVLDEASHSFMLISSCLSIPRPSPSFSFTADWFARHTGNKKKNRVEKTWEFHSDSHAPRASNSPLLIDKFDTSWKECKLPLKIVDLRKRIVFDSSSYAHLKLELTSDVKRVFFWKLIYVSSTHRHNKESSVELRIERCFSSSRQKKSISIVRVSQR